VPLPTHRRDSARPVASPAIGEEESSRGSSPSCECDVNPNADRPRAGLWIVAHAITRFGWALLTKAVADRMSYMLTYGV
jgi:hypothetical protein